MPAPFPPHPASDLPEGLEITSTTLATASEILSPAAVTFVAQLGRRFDPRRGELLALREVGQHDLFNGRMPAFLPETCDIREVDWTVAPIPKDLEDRRVEITGPVDRKMII